MTGRKMRDEMRHCRAVYRGIGSPLLAYLKNRERINRTYEYGKQMIWLQKYNAELKNRKEGK